MGKYSGPLVKVNKADIKADLLRTKLGGESRVRFGNDPDGREFDVVSDAYIAQTNVGKQAISKNWRKAAKATFEAAMETNRIPYFHFENQPGPDILRKIADYEQRYGVGAVVDVSPF